jgi:hypothetical protein
MKPRGFADVGMDSKGGDSMAKKIAMVVLLFVLCVCLANYLFPIPEMSIVQWSDPDGRFFPAVVDYVNANREWILSHILDLEELHYEGKAMQLFEDGYVDGLRFEADGTIVFDTDGIGLVPSTRYVGFYYSPKDIPVWVYTELFRKPLTVEPFNYPLAPYGNGWKPDTSSFTEEQIRNPWGDNDIYTEKIADCFYYFEVST